MKLWIYQHYILSKLAWPFLIHDFNLDFATKLQQNANVYLKRWAGVLKGADAGVLYRPKRFLGLGLTSLSTQLKKMQITKCHICQNSTDEEIRVLYEQRESQEKAQDTVWKATKELTKAEQIIEH